jgi:hypothetical protein
MKIGMWLSSPVAAMAQSAVGCSGSPGTGWSGHASSSVCKAVEIFAMAALTRASPRRGFAPEGIGRQIPLLVKIRSSRRNGGKYLPPAAAVDGGTTAERHLRDEAERRGQGDSPQGHVGHIDDASRDRNVADCAKIKDALA